MSDAGDRDRQMAFGSDGQVERPTSVWGFRLNGAMAAALALSVTWAASRLDPSAVFPPTGFAGRVIRLAPGDVATFFIETLEHNALRLLALGVLLSFLILGALIGSVRREHPSVLWRGGGFGAVLAGAAFSAPVGASVPLVVVTCAVAGAVYGVALAWLDGASEAARSGEGDLSRRQALGRAGSAAAGFILTGTLLGRLLPGETGREGLAIAVPPRTAKAPSPATAFRALPGLSPEVTSTADHYVVDINLEKPVVDVASWSLEISGLVDEPLELGFDELQDRFTVVEEYSVLTCVSNEVGGPLIGNSKWTGVRLREVLSAAGVQADARDLALTCADGYTVGIPLERAMERSALLAIAQNGEPLTVEHGFPCRLRVPKLYGMMNAKWLERIEVVGSDFRGYWAERGWTDVATVRTQSKIDTVAPAPRQGESTWVAGVAWAGDRGISRVEVSLDGRTWRAAEVRKPLSALAWTQWAFRFVPASPGAQLIACRAIDGSGELQDDEPRRPHPSGATGYHRVSVQVA